jgi:hypothetical protein
MAISGAERTRIWRTTNPTQAKARDRAQHYRALYSLTIEEYDALYEAQNGACAICLQPETTIRQGQPLRLAVDHDHATGAVRGLLCQRCNRLIGIIEVDERLLLAARAYLDAV